MSFSRSKDSSIPSGQPSRLSQAKSSHPTSNVSDASRLSSLSTSSSGSIPHISNKAESKSADEDSLYPLIVVRHSERLDEADPVLFQEFLRKSTVPTAREIVYRAIDPPLTTNGVTLARQTSDSLQTIISQYSPSSIKLYSSKLIRAVQTAHEISTLLSLPIYLSSGLSLSVVAVKSRKSSYIYANTEEYHYFCPTLNSVDCDNEEDIENHIKNNSWKEAVSSIWEKNPHSLNIIISHREMIRKLEGLHLSTPCCCIAIFEAGQHSAATVKRGESSLGMIRRERTSSAASPATTAAMMTTSDGHQFRFFIRQLLTNLGRPIPIR